MGHQPLLRDDMTPIPYPPFAKPSSFFTLPATLLSNAPPVAAFDPNYQLPTVHQWNLSMQMKLPKGFVAQAAYIGLARHRFATCL